MNIEFAIHRGARLTLMKKRERTGANRINKLLESYARYLSQNIGRNRASASVGTKHVEKKQRQGETPSSSGPRIFIGMARIRDKGGREEELGTGEHRGKRKWHFSGGWKENPRTIWEGGKSALTIIRGGFVAGEEGK